MSRMRRDLMVADYRFEDPVTGKRLPFHKGGIPAIYLFSRDAKRQRKITRVTTFRPHCWVADSTSPEVDLYGRPIKHMIYDNPRATRKLRKGYPYHDEADIRFWLRYLIDMGILCGYEVDENGVIGPCKDLDIPPLRLYFDIEVGSKPEILPRPSNPEHPIVSFQFSNNYDDELVVMLLDCETTSGKWLSEEIPKGFTVTIKHKGGEETLKPDIRFFKTETAMIKAAIDYIDEKDPDIPTGWNSDLFDFPYLVRRCDALQFKYFSKMSPFDYVELRTLHGRRKNMIDRDECLLGFCDLDEEDWSKYSSFKEEKASIVPVIKGRDPVDMLKAYTKWTSGRQPIVKGRPFGLTYDLKIVVEYETGLTYEDYGDRVNIVRKEDPIAWVTYCTIDGYALKLLDKVTGLFKHFDRLRRLYGVPVSWSLHNSRLCDTWLLRIRERPLPSRSQRFKKRSKGAFVFLPKIGLHEYVALIDLKTMYPIAIIAFNLSPETKDPNGKIKVGPLEDGTILRFKKSPEGLLPRAVRMTYEEREKYRAQLRSMGKGHSEYEKIKQLETLYKFLTCSYFGFTGYEGARIFDEEIKRAILYLGRRCLLECKAAVEQAGYEVIYGDTDSLFIKLRSRHPGEGRILERIINNVLTSFAYRHGATKIVPEAKYEDCFRRLIFKPKFERKLGRITAAKKRYAGITIDNRLVVVGLEPRRSSTAAVTRETMLKWLDLVLLQGDVEGSLELLRQTSASLKDIPINKVAIPKGIHKAEYKTRNPWLDGCIYMQKHFGIRFREDKKPMLIYMHPKRVAKKEQTDVICIAEDITELPSELQGAVNWKAMEERVLRRTFEPLLKAIGYDWSYLETGIQQVGLAQWQQ